ncbi:oligosaccharide repeat unit polymerase [Acinetobacter bereziniae]|uniref:O-antigen polymerase n=1 Tax=Acinetobacter bereziniae TaxID=106648 RepID=UPI002866DC09|nr:O-antigen polymerase [Acinetobacter bereziniae]MDR6543217.1 oligosaccharide repeat unit polymerase [Acinetobacter bereziniae]
MISLFIFLLVFCTVLGLSILAFSIPFQIKYLNLISYQYFLNFIFLVVPGSIAILLGFRDDLALYPVRDETVIYTCIAICWCLIAFPTTITILDLLLKQNIKRKLIDYKMKKIVHFNNGDITKRNVVIVTIFAFFFLVLLMALLPVIPIFHVGASAEFIMNSRLESAFDLPPIVYFFRRILIYFFPIYFIYLFVLKSYLDIDKKVLFVTFICTIFILTYSTEKAPVVLFILAIFFAKNLIGKNYSLSIRKIIPLILIFIVLFVSMFAFFYNNSVGDAKTSLLVRMFVSQIAGSYLSMEYYGDNAPFKMFHAVLFRLDALLGNIPTMQTSEELVYYYYPDLYNGNLWRNVNSFIIQGAWSNFGWVGIIIAPIWCAIVIYLGCLYIVNKPKTASNLAVYSYSAIFMASLSTNFNNFIYSSGLLLTIFIWAFLKKL